MTPASVVVVVAVLLAAAVPAAHAQPGAPARDPGPRVPGTSVIRGIVIDAHTGAPVRRAIVSTVVNDGEARNTLTDAEGRFELRELRPGVHRLTATKSGYQFPGQTARPPRPQVVELADKQTVEKVVLQISRGGVITGRILDEYGDPVPGVQVRPLHYRYENGGRRLGEVYGPFGRNVSDDRGVFRLFALPPGQYFVSAHPDAFGQLRTDPALSKTGNVTTFYPGAPDPSAAQRVTVAAGKETAGVDITLVSARLARIRGRAFMSNGAPFTSGTVQVRYREFNTSTGRSGGSIRPDGTFELTGVPPGTYELRVDASGGSGPPSEIAQTNVTVTGDDLDEVLMIGVAAGIARGRAVSDDGTPLPFRPNQVGLMPRPATHDQMIYFSTRPTLNEDFTFELKGLLGPMRFRAFVSDSAGWVLKSARWEDKDLADTALDFSGRTIDGIELVFTQKRTMLRGQLTDDRGRPAEDAWLVLFAADESLWGYETRHVMAVQARRDGEYRFAGMPAHDHYLLAAVPDMEQGQWQDPDFLRALKERATAISLAEGETNVQNLRMSRTPQ